MVYREIGRRIQQAREESGLTQEELAARLGCTQSALSNYELGKRRLYLSLLNEIAQVLGKPLDYFLESPVEEHDDGVSSLLADPQLKEILISASSLSAKERKLVLDFINWRKNQR
jgi:transcriptional regulator with XRE-family HTH domain